MGKLLSKQVAELEAEIALCDTLHSTQLSENRGKHADKWASICAELDLNPNETQIGQLATAIRDRAGVDLERCWDITDELRDERDRLESENTALRAGQGHWPEHDDSPAGEQVPRVISADELTLGAGQWIAYRNYNPPHEWIVDKYDKDEFSPHYDGTIVLLEDAPEPFVMADWERELLQEKADDDPAPRLTVHALNTAPVGSTVSTPGKTRTKRDDGTWFTVSAFGQHTRTSEELLALGYANATLTYPEGDDNE